jgi:peptidoglycan/LPS O-acetylase OafA/YrhL
MKRQAELDYLRGIACLMVVFFHFLYRGQMDHWTGEAVYPSVAPIAKYGYLGVHLFFMISGYVIYKSALGRSAKEFASGRFWRLFPAYWAAIVLTSCVVYILHGTHFEIPGKDMIWNLTMLHSLFGMKSVDGAYWSLVVELVFYCYVGLAIKLNVLHRTKGIAIVWLALCLANIVVDSHWINTLFLTRWAPFFLIGIMAFKVREGDRSVSSWAVLIASAGVAIFQSFWLARHAAAVSADRWEWMLVAALVAIFVAIVHRPRKVVPNKMSNSFGDLTYPVYLTHQNVGFLLLAAYSGVVGSWIALCIVLLVSLAMGFVVNQLVERRLTSEMRKLTSHAVL